MILTFALFVGLGVVVVGLYVVFQLRDDIQDAARLHLVQQADRVAALIDRAETDQALRDVVLGIARVTDLEVAVVSPAGMRIRAVGGRELEAPRLIPVAEGEVDVSWLRGTAGETRLEARMRTPERGLLLSVTAPEPPFMLVVRRVLVTLVAGMFLMLVLALLGAWVAAYQVTKPLQAIRDSARSISEGMFEERIRVDSRAAEFQDLARRLNRMSSGFREKIDELQRLAQIQNEFIGNVSHEVRNPIFAVGGYLEALGTPGLRDDQRQRYAEKGLSNLQRLNNLFNDLIEIARLEYREDLIQPSEFELQELLDEVVDLLRPKAQEKGLRLEARNAPIEVRADRNRVRQVLTNLIDNAISYTDEGAVRCRFRRRLHKVRIEVVDTGRGIPEDHLERVFERFYRVDPDRSRKSGGTGLGLSIVKQILHAHGESIHVESTVGRGTRFWFELPHAGPTWDAGAGDED
jgi:signal transduction histidine kinase